MGGDSGKSAIWPRRPCRGFGRLRSSQDTWRRMAADVASAVQPAPGALIVASRLRLFACLLVHPPSPALCYACGCGCLRFVWDALAAVVGTWKLGTTLRDRLTHSGSGLDVPRDSSTCLDIITYDELTWYDTHESRRSRTAHQTRDSVHQAPVNAANASVASAQQRRYAQRNTVPCGA